VLRPVTQPRPEERRPHALPAIRDIDWERTDLAALERATVEARRALEEAATAATAAAQRALEAAAALDETLAAVAIADLDRRRAQSTPAAVEPGLGALSSREMEVLALVAAGRTNKAIADALFVSPNTVKTHVGSLLGKLGAESRSQLAAIAARSGILGGGTVAPR
jgi:DNA-binding NarL/FixJ family response regulator